MVNLELAGGVDFKKGCYPGQEIVARAQYRGAVKRRMVRLRGAALQPGQEIYSDDMPGQPSGTIVNASADEALAVLQVSSIESKSPIRVAPLSGALEVFSLPYSR
jgi:folate-binding Fe-S cluster repair protein YgfZ